MTRPEKVAEQKAVNKAFELGVRSIKLTPQGQRGWNDRLFWVPGGRPLLVEFKREGEEPRKLQTHRHETLRDLGYETMVAVAWEPVLEKLRAMLSAEHDRRRMLDLVDEEAGDLR